MEVKNIGQLNYEKIIVRFDIPLLFTCTDINDNRYIVVCADEENGLYVVGKTNISDLLHMLKNEITMYDYFRQREKLYTISYDYDSGEFVWEPTSQDLINDDMLPDKGAYLELSNDSICDYIEQLKNIDLYENWNSKLKASLVEYVLNTMDDSVSKYYIELLHSITSRIIKQSITISIDNKKKESEIILTTNRLTESSISNKQLKCSIPEWMAA